MSALKGLGQLLEAAKLSDRVVWVNDNLVRMQWGSAYVVLGLAGSAIGALAPLFRTAPNQNTAAFYLKLLTHNAYMGGIASFAVQPDGWIVLQAARPTKGLDGEELATMVAGVGKFADLFDDLLMEEFYLDQPDAANRAPV